MARPKKVKTAEVTAPVVEEVKTEAPVETEVPAEEVATEVEVAVEETEVPVVEEKKAKKAPVKRVKKETTITLEFGDYTANMAVVEERVRAQFVADGHKASEIKTLNIYVKPFENSAYYVINETETGRVDLF